MTRRVEPVVWRCRAARPGPASSVPGPAGNDISLIFRSRCHDRGHQLSPRPLRGM